MALHNPNRAKLHRNYSVEEIADLYDVHKNTVRQWIKQGLPVIDDVRPMLILGRDLRDFLSNKRTQRKSKCKLEELYCVRCKAPKKPAMGIVDYHPRNDSTGRLEGLCPDCDGLIGKFSSVKKLAVIKKKLEVTITKA